MLFYSRRAGFVKHDYVSIKSLRIRPYHGLVRFVRTWLQAIALSMLMLGVVTSSGVAHAEDTPAQLLKAAEQRLHWVGLYLPEVEVTISDDKIATITGTVSSDIIKAEVVQAVELTSGIRGVVNKLKVLP